MSKMHDYLMGLLRETAAHSGEAFPSNKQPLQDFHMAKSNNYILPRIRLGLVNISDWYGRFGNNVSQLIHACLLSEKFNCEFFYPRHPYFKDKDWEDHVRHLKKWCSIPYFHTNDTLFSRTDFEKKHFEVSVDDERRICRDKITELISIPNYDIPEDVVVFNIRTGDCFLTDEDNPHPNFLQPPLSFYTAIMEKESVTDLSKVWIVTNDEKPQNPVIKELEKMGCRLFEETIPWCITMLSNARVGAMCRSSFSKFSFFFSKKIKRLYIPDYYCEEDNFHEVTDIDLFKVNLPDYIKQGTWEASQSQLNTMIDYDSDITIDKLGVD